MRFLPYDYQKFCIDKIISTSNLALLLDMGLGKTIITLTAIEQLLYDYCEPYKVLVIAPLRPARETWPTEIEKWEHLGSLSYSLVLGTEKERLTALYKKADIYIINRENVTWLVEFYKKRWPFNFVVIDELSSFKSSRATRFRELKKVRHLIKRLVGLTGTPAPNGLTDLWAQMFLIDGGQALGRTKSSFLEKWFTPDKHNATTVFSYKPRDGAEDEIYDALKLCTVSMKTEDYITLPERLNITHEVELPPNVYKQYKKLEKEMLLPFESGDIDAGTAGILVNKLLQFCGGMVYDENGGVKEFHHEKLKVLDGLIEEANGKPVLVFYTYKSERNRILQNYPEAVDIKSAGAVEKWNNGEIQILLAHPASAGHGLNLQFGGNIVIWYNLTWSLELYQQANKRLHRMGQKETVLIHHITVKGGVDTRILGTVLQTKAKTQNALIEALKAEMREMQ